MADPGITRRGVIASSAILALTAAVATTGAGEFGTLLERCRLLEGEIKAASGERLHQLCELEDTMHDRLAHLPAPDVAGVRDKFRLLFGDGEKVWRAAGWDWSDGILADLERLS